jgi:hypothetical protein
MDEMTMILTELAIARVTLRAGLPGQSITIEQAQHLIDKSHDHIITAIALLRGDKPVSPPAIEGREPIVTTKRRREVTTRRP